VQHVQDRVRLFAGASAAAGSALMRDRGCLRAGGWTCFRRYPGGLRHAVRRAAARCRSSARSGICLVGHDFEPGSVVRPSEIVLTSACIFRLAHRPTNGSGPSSCSSWASLSAAGRSAHPAGPRRTSARPRGPAIVRRPRPAASITWRITGPPGADRALLPVPPLIRATTSTFYCAVNPPAGPRGTPDRRSCSAGPPPRPISPAIITSSTCHVTMKASPSPPRVVQLVTEGRGASDSLARVPAASFIALVGSPVRSSAVRVGGCPREHRQKISCTRRTGVPDC